MITVEDAKTKLQKYTTNTKSKTVKLEEALNSYLAEDLISPTDNPPFNQSAVDGYGILYEGELSKKYELIDEIPAGKKSEVYIQSGQTVRIFTGAQVPDSVNTVIMQEQLDFADNGHISFKKHDIKINQHIRFQSEQIKKGDLALKKGHFLNAAAIGFLASIGVRELNIFNTPKIKIIITGSELVDNFDDFKDGKIFESNGQMLKAALKSYSVEADFIKVEDNPDLLYKKIKEELNHSDILILSGGVSVGDYDFTREALEKNGFDTIFHKISQKPGKPLLFSKNREKFAFGLPGNPRAALICFYEYILPFLKMMMGSTSPFPVDYYLPLASDFKKKGNRLNFVIGKIINNEVLVLSGQGSHMLKSFSEGDVIVQIPSELTLIEKGKLVKVHGF